MTEEEREHLEQLSRESGLSLSDTVRSCISGTEIRQRQGVEIKDLYTAVNRIGNNINQIARSFNAGTAGEKDAHEALLLLHKVYDLMEAVADL